MAAAAVGRLPAVSPQLSRVDTHACGLPPWLFCTHAPPWMPHSHLGRIWLCFPAPLPQETSETCSQIPVNHGTWKLRSSCPWTGCSKDFSFAHKAILFHDPSEEGMLLLLQRRQHNSVDATEEECEMPFSL